MKSLSPGEELFAQHCAFYNIHLLREYRFNPDRKWRVDFCLPDRKIAIEIEGGTWSGGRHGTGSGMEKDMEKYNSLALAGYRLLRFSTGMVKSGVAIDTLRAMLRD